jgi:hypothetical protein
VSCCTFGHHLGCNVKLPALEIMIVYPEIASRALVAGKRDYPSRRVRRRICRHKAFGTTIRNLGLMNIAKAAIQISRVSLLCHNIWKEPGPRVTKHQSMYLLSDA